MKRLDLKERPELLNGVYDVIAPKKYITDPVHEIFLCIVIETTKYMVNSGIFGQILASLEQILEEI